MLKTNAVTRRFDKSALWSQKGRRSNTVALPTTPSEVINKDECNGKMEKNDSGRE
jgi:hypothetical protein